jgi:hypothetical protein
MCLLSENLTEFKGLKMSTTYHYRYERLIREGKDVELRKQPTLLTSTRQLDGLAQWESFIRDFLVATYDVNPRILAPSKKKKKKVFTSKASAGKAKPSKKK